MASFGEVLRQERELRGIELREVAEATKISVRFLQALENDRLDVLPGGIFPRAFVRQYASYLGLDPDRMVNEFLYAQGASVPPVGSPSASAGTAQRPSRAPGPGRGPVVLAVLAAAVLLVLGVWATVRFAVLRPRPTPPPASVPSSFPPDQVYPPPAASPTLSATAEGLIVGLQARQECWVSVHADGAKVIDRVLAQGETQTITARSEVVLTVGNAGGLSFTINGRPGVSLGREGEVRRNVMITRESLASLVQEPGTQAVSLPPVG